MTDRKVKCKDPPVEQEERERNPEAATERATFAQATRIVSRGQGGGGGGHVWRPSVTCKGNPLEHVPTTLGDSG